MLEGVATHSKTTVNTESLWMRSGAVGNDELAVTFPGPERDALKAQVARLFHDYHHGAVLFGKPDVYAVATDAVDFDSAVNHVGGLTTNQYSQIEYWSPAG